ncbi:hypothetical protein F5Y01DRAFT_319015 [Xylaria sp. FL0043]|nr:hypothetical protein F5Y01DRAFT_319015 [Xylaria sp. FL0043]
MAKYAKLQDEKYSSDESDQASCDLDVDQWHLSLLQAYGSRSRSRWVVLGILWVTSILITVVITAFTTWKILAYNEFGTLASGYSSDFGPARAVASIQQYRFTGSPHFDEDKGEYIPPESPSWRYIGSGPEVDSAWEELVKNRYFLLTDEEAKEAWGDDYTEYWNNNRGGYLGGLDMFHTLHCLDHIRKSFYPNEYVLDGLHGEMHQLHCVDHLRQMIQCNADMTIIPTRWYGSIDQNYIDSDMTHTCRDFTKVREWVSSRYNGALAVKPRHRNGSLWENYYLPE